MCDRLAAKRFITRRRPASDRRIVRLALSVRGRTLVNAVTERRRAEIARILDVIPRVDHDGLVRAFHAFGEAAGEMPDTQWSRSWGL